MTSLLALAIPFGFFVLIVAGGLAGMLKGELQDREDYILIFSSLGICIVLFFLVSIVIFKRKRFWKRQKRTQFLLCTLSIITGLSAIGGFILLGAIIL